MGYSREAPWRASFPAVSCSEAPAAPLPQPRPGAARPRFLCLTACSLHVGNLTGPRFDPPSRVQVAGSPCSVPAASGGPSCSSGAARKRWQETRPQRAPIARWCLPVGNRREQEAVNIFLEAPILETEPGGVLQRQEKNVRLGTMPDLLSVTVNLG